MRSVIWLILLFVAAVVAASVFGQNDALVSLFYGHWRLDMSLNLFLLLLLGRHDQGIYKRSAQTGGKPQHHVLERKCQHQQPDQRQHPAHDDLRERERNRPRPGELS